MAPAIERYLSLNGAEEERGPMGAIVDVPVLGRSVHPRCSRGRIISDGENSSASLLNLPRWFYVCKALFSLSYPLILCSRFWAPQSHHINYPRPSTLSKIG